MSIQGNWDRRHVNRRHFLGWAGMGAGALALGATGVSHARTHSHPLFADDPFKLGLASGDPLPDGVVLWTRLAPDPLNGGGMPDRKVPVEWQVATDERFADVVREGTSFAIPELAHSVHVEVSGLRPASEYFYRFKAGPELSPVARTRTAPAIGAPVDRLTFAFASCQNYTNGYYTAYQNMAREDLDLVVHLGDYIYEGIGGGVRQHDGPEPRTLAAYRNRHALYKTDQDLQGAHAAFAFVVTWDDHEVENNYADEESDPDTDPAEFRRRRAAAYQAYYEHMPLRSSSIPKGPDLQLYRRVQYGDMATFSVLDTRQYRSDQPVCADATCSAALDPSRTMLGDEQERWLLDGLDRSTGRWNVLAQQVPLHLRDTLDGPGIRYGGDKWDGYVAQRRRLLEFLDRRRPSNPIVLTGDVHSNRVADLLADFENPDSPIVASEFVGTSISSGGAGTPVTTYGGDPENPWIKFSNRLQRGYVRCTLDRETFRSDYRMVDTVRQPQSAIDTLASFEVHDGERGVHLA